MLSPTRALLLSLALHGLVLAALADGPNIEPQGVAPMEPLRVSVRMPAEAGEARADAEHRVTLPRRSKPLPTIARLAASAQGAVSPAPTLSEAPSPVENAASGYAPGGIPQQKNVVAPATVAMAAPAEVRGPDAAGLRQFRLSLASEARRVRNYPEAARRIGLTGTAEIRVSVNALSQRHAELARSSGHALLDEAALAMLRIAAERSPLPESLRGQEFAVLLPVVFEVGE